MNVVMCKCGKCYIISPCMLLLALLAVAALFAGIREEIREVEQSKYCKENNVLKVSLMISTSCVIKDNGHCNYCVVTSNDIYAQ